MGDVLRTIWRAVAEKAGLLRRTDADLMPLPRNVLPARLTETERSEHAQMTQLRAALHSDRVA